VAGAACTSIPLFTIMGFLKGGRTREKPMMMMMMKKSW
jgi:hypothetical protein